MLRFLRIRNLAVIESVDVEFEPGFNVLTGETGAGKSILIEAVGLLLGGRASADLVRSGEAAATIEALFDADLPDHPGELVLRREISSQGRSRSFVNGTLATSSVLRDLSPRLVELHGQHEHQALLDPATHLPLLDTHAGLDDDARRVAEAWNAFRALRDRLDRLRMDGREKAARLDLIAFQLGEIEKAALKPNEDEDLAATRQVLASAERVQRLCEESYASLYDSDTAILAGLGGVWKRVAELALLEPQFAPYVQAREAIKSQLEDLAFFLRSYADGVDASPARLQQVEDRLALLERLKRKYGPSLQEVIDRGAALREERALLSEESSAATDLHHAVGDARDRFVAIARDLSRRRREAGAAFSRRLETLLAELAMPRTRFSVRFSDGELPEDAWSERGIDQAEFYLSPNVGEDLRPLARIVSGGELSRVMLALKTMAVQKPERGEGHSAARSLSLVFDEVDAGIGGRVADVVGARLRELGDSFQVLCITHLPQIAARATTQFRIEKAVRAGRTTTSVERLAGEKRVDEIARMLGGAAVTERLREGAREMLAAANPSPQAADRSQAKGKQKAKGESERG